MTAREQTQPQRRGNGSLIGTAIREGVDINGEQDQTPSSPGRIVVGVDGSQGSIDALRWARRLTATLDAHIVAVIAWQEFDSYGRTMGQAEARGDANAAHVLETALKAAFGDAPPPGLQTMIHPGHPAQALLDASAAAEMLIVGSRGRGSVAAALIGSVSVRCAELATCPVLVIHPARPTGTGLGVVHRVG